MPPKQKKVLWELNGITLFFFAPVQSEIYLDLNEKLLYINKLKHSYFTEVDFSQTIPLDQVKFFSDGINYLTLSFKLDNKRVFHIVDLFTKQDKALINELSDELNDETDDFSYENLTSWTNYKFFTTLHGKFRGFTADIAKKMKKGQEYLVLIYEYENSIFFHNNSADINLQLFTFNGLTKEEESTYNLTDSIFTGGYNGEDYSNWVYNLFHYEHTNSSLYIVEDLHANYIPVHLSKFRKRFNKALARTKKLMQ